MTQCINVLATKSDELCSISGTHKERRVPIAENCPLILTDTPWHGHHSHMHTYIHTDAKTQISIIKIPPPVSAIQDKFKYIFPFTFLNVLNFSLPFMAFPPVVD